MYTYLIECYNGMFLIYTLLSIAIQCGQIFYISSITTDVKEIKKHLKTPVVSGVNVIQDTEQFIS